MGIGNTVWMLNRRGPRFQESALQQYCYSMVQIFVRFVPNEENGSTATLDFYGWDQSNNPTLASNNTTTLTTGEQGDAGAYSLTGNHCL